MRRSNALIPYVLVACLGVMLFSQPASAKIYKCTDANGRVSFNDKPCKNQQQETVKLRSFPKAPKPPGKAPSTTPAKPFQSEAGKKFFGDNGKNPAVAGKKSSRSSPLAKAYTQFLNSLSRCRKIDVLKHVSEKTAQGMTEMPTLTFVAFCQFYKSNSRTDYDNAMESITGNKGTLVWEDKKTRIDGDETMRMTTTETIYFTKVNGHWIYGN